MQSAAGSLATMKLACWILCAPEGGKPCFCGFLEHLSFADHPCQVGLLSSFVSTDEGLECQGASGADALRSAVQQPTGGQESLLFSIFCGPWLIKKLNSEPGLQ